MFLEIKENSWINTTHILGIQILQKADTKCWHAVFHLADSKQTLMSGIFQSADIAQRWLRATMGNLLILAEGSEAPGPADDNGFIG